MQPTPEFDDEQLKVLQQLLAQETARTEAALVQGGYQGMSQQGMTPEIVAGLQRSLIAPAHPTRHPQVQEPKRPPYLAMTGMGCATLLAMAWIIGASLPGARGTAEINTSTMALADATRAIAENQQRPNEICILSLGCGGHRQKEDDSQELASATAEQVSPYQLGLEEAQSKYAAITDSPRHIEAVIAQLERSHEDAASRDEKLRLEAHLQYLRRL